MERQINVRCIHTSQVRPQIPELTCLVQMNNSSLDGIERRVDNTYGSMSSRIKQEPMTSMHNTMNHGRDSATSQHMDMHNDAIEYIPNPLDDANIQGNPNLSFAFYVHS